MPRKAKSQAVAAPQDQGYGQRGEQMAAQRAMPLPDNQAVTEGAIAPPAAPAPRSADLSAALAGAQGLAPPSLLTSPSERPNEPFTSGLPSGPGPGMSPMQAPVNEMDTLVETLRAAYSIMPTRGILSLLEQATSRQR